LRSVSRSAVRHRSLDLGLLSEDLFTKLLAVERRRTERSGRRFVLMLLDPGRLLKTEQAGQTMGKIQKVISFCTRDTDFKGWYREGSIIGVIFTEVRADDDNSVVRSLSTKFTDVLYESLTVQEINEIKLSFHVFPEDWDEAEPDDPATSTLKLVLALETNWRTKASLGIKRLVDIAGSLAAIILLLPLFALIALAVKLTSRGPVLFRQVRLGQYGRKFTFLKFRSMHVNNDHSIHEEYVKRFIAGAGNGQSTGNGQEVFKLTQDPRVTPLGRFLRKTSLDELPQFFNVLAGEMSLVGPRPPVMYEYENYGLWHRRRLAAVKPGITGLWQVEGRSQVTFDEMVRLDIRYAMSWSLWLDFRILIETPRAVIAGTGAC